jgi:hypothetical protein
MPQTAPTSTERTWKAPDTQRGDIVVVEDLRSRLWEFGTARLSPGSEMITYTLLGRRDSCDNWVYRAPSQRYRVLITGDPDTHAQRDRRLAFLEVAGAIEGQITAAAVAELINAHKPL